MKIEQAFWQSEAFDALGSASMTIVYLPVKY